MQNVQNIQNVQVSDFCVIAGGDTVDDTTEDSFNDDQVLGIEYHRMFLAQVVTELLPNQIITPGVYCIRDILAAAEADVATAVVSDKPIPTNTEKLKLLKTSWATSESKPFSQIELSGVFLKSPPQRLICTSTSNHLLSNHHTKKVLSVFSY